MSTLILIPAFNEEKNIGKLITTLKDKGFDVLVIDDGSLDNTAYVSERNGAQVIRHKTNRGKGFSLIEGLKIFCETAKYKDVIIMDGDGQHSPNDIKKFIHCRHEKNAEFILGNRMTRYGKMPIERVLTNWLMSLLLSIKCGQQIPDSQCGFKLLSKESVKKMNLESKNYDIDSEMLLEAAKNKIKIYSVPISSIYKSEVSNIKPLRDGLRFLKLLFKK